MSAKFFLIAILALSSLSKAASHHDRTLSYRCSDTVVVGSIKNRSFNHIENSGDIPGYGIVNAELSVRKMVKGQPNSDFIPVTYVAHTYMVEGRDFLFVLSKKQDGTFEIKTGQRMSLHPRLAAHCD